jgi:hypothetical protein
MMTWQKKSGVSRSMIPVTQCNVPRVRAVNDSTGTKPGDPCAQEGRRQAMQNTVRDLMSATIKDYAEELRRLIETEQERSASLMRRIDYSMDVIQRTDRLLGK